MMPPKPSWKGVLWVEALLLLSWLMGMDFFLVVWLAFWGHTLLAVYLWGSALWALIVRKASTGTVWWLAGSTVVLGIIAYATLIEPNRLQVRTVTLDLPEVHQPVRLLHISDIQSDGIGAYERAVFARMQELDPDLIIHTGDLVHVSTRKKEQEALQQLAALFQTLDPPHGIYHVSGDVDQRMDAENFGKVAGVHVLDDRNAQLNIGTTTWHLIGLSLPQSRFATATGLQERLQHLHDDEVSVLMGHAPDFVMPLTDQAVDLCLAGHTHGGQVRLPGWGPLVTLSRVPRAWSRGFLELPGTRLNVSAGIGAEHAFGLPSIRLNCPPEVTLLIIQ